MDNPTSQTSTAAGSTTAVSTTAVHDPAGADQEPDTADVVGAAISQAVTALTAVAHARRYDFGEVVVGVVTAVAANVGCVETLLSVRPGSWEADHVRRIVESATGGHDVILAAARTEPLRLRLDPEDELTDLGVWALYDEAQTAILAADEPGISEEQAELIHREVEALDALWTADVAAYAAAYVEELCHAARERGFTVPVEVEPVGTLTQPTTDPEPVWDEVASELHALARQRTPLPTSGTAPRDYPREPLPDLDWTTPGDHDRAAGRTYTARLSAHLATSSTTDQPTSERDR